MSWHCDTGDEGSTPFDPLLVVLSLATAQMDTNAEVYQLDEWQGMNA